MLFHVERERAIQFALNGGTHPHCGCCKIGRKLEPVLIISTEEGAITEDYARRCDCRS